MLVEYKKEFLKFIASIKHEGVKEHVKRQIERIVDDPTIGKPMRHARKDTREVYVTPYRLAYAYDAHNDTLTFLEIYHKDEQ